MTIEDRVRRPDAILIVHGIGEQVTNDTARSLAVALADAGQDRVRSAADPKIDGSKQRVYAIVWDLDAPTISPESHISEGYWAYRFRDTTWSHLTGWVIPLLIRRRRDVPVRLKVGRPWLSSLIVIIALLVAAVIVGGIWAQVPLSVWLADIWPGGALVVSGVVFVLGVIFVTPRIAVPGPVAWGVVALAALLLGGLLFVVDLLFGWVSEATPPTWFMGVGISALALLVLAAVAVDVLTSVRVLAVVTATVVLALVGTATNQDDAATSVLALLASAAAPWASAVTASLLLPSLGDAARYFRDHPSNEDETRKIRKIVIDKLRDLHRLEQGQPRFERVIVIGHSLGSVIAYDAINHFWAENHGSLTIGGQPDCNTCALRDRASLHLEAAAAALVSGSGDLSAENSRNSLVEFRAAQWELSSSLRAEPTEDHLKHLEGAGVPDEPAWQITDFITVGCPLASVSFLAEPGVNSSRNSEPRGANLAPDDVRRRAESWFESKLAAREYPSIPPLPQTAVALDPLILFSNFPLRYPAMPRGQPSNRRILNHAATFAAVRWTNVYFENDLVGGPISAQLGRGVLDIEIPVAPPTPRNFASLFSHSSYWTEPSLDRLASAATTSRNVLRDLIKLEVDRDTLTPVEVDGIETRADVVLCESSPAQTAVNRRLDRLRSRRQAAFSSARLRATWSATLDTVGQGRPQDIAELLALLREIRETHGKESVAVVSYGEVAIYRLSGDEFHQLEYRTLALEPVESTRRCRTVTEDNPWPGVLEERELDAIRTWIHDYLAVDLG